MSGQEPEELRIAFPNGPTEEEREALDEARKRFDELTCTTIHGFCHALLRTYAVEAAIDPGADILDARQADLAFRTIFDRWLRDRLDRDEASRSDRPHRGIRPDPRRKTSARFCRIPAKAPDGAAAAGKHRARRDVSVRRQRRVSSADGSIPWAVRLRPNRISPNWNSSPSTFRGNSIRCRASTAYGTWRIRRALRNHAPKRARPTELPPPRQSGGARRERSTGRGWRKRPGRITTLAPPRFGNSWERSRPRSSAAFRRS